MLTDREKIRSLLQGAIWSIKTLYVDDADRLIEIFIASLTDEQAAKLASQPLDVFMMSASFYFRGRADGINEAAEQIRRSPW